MNIRQYTSHRRYCDVAMRSKRVQNSKTALLYRNNNRGVGTKRDVLQACIELHGVAILMMMMRGKEKSASTGMPFYVSLCLFSSRVCVWVGGWGGFVV